MIVDIFHLAHGNYLKVKGKIFELNDSYFNNKSITASSETSTLSDVTGTGEVNIWRWK